VIYTIRWKRNFEAAQSKRRTRTFNLFQVRQRARLAFQSVINYFIVFR
jgi:hypothetical protein